MRKIEFRFWDIVGKKMVYKEDIETQDKEWPVLLALGLHGLPIAIDKDSFKGTQIIGWNINHNRVPLQYVGIKDKNGKKIFEGDIVAYQDYYRAYEDYFLNKGVVEYWDYAFSFSNRETVDMEDIDWDEVEVIGNIYEHPNLLK